MKYKTNIFYSEEQLICKNCKHCDAYQISNFGYEKLYCFCYKSSEMVDFFKESQINDNSICVNCLKYL